ncbi:helix-turn-helix domain-containing protein [Saltatorellus ferox]
MSHISTKDAALALGVSESSIRRWVDRGALKGERTEGGHRRIRTSDLVSYATSQGLTWHRGVPPASSRPLGGIDSKLDEVITALVEADFEGAKRLVLALHAAGHGLGPLFDLLITPAMACIGDRWHGGREGILDEHAATAVTAAVIRCLRDVDSSRVGPVSIGGAIEGDPYSLPSQMADTILHGLGYSSFDLGPNTPVATIGEAAVRKRAQLVWISVNSVRDPVTQRKEILDTLEAHASRDRRFLLGGRALAELRVPAMDHVHQVASMRELEAIAAR